MWRFLGKFDKGRLCSIWACIIVAVMLEGCASILDDRTQTVTIDSEPQGAKCRVIRSGVVIGEVPITPSSLSIRKSNYDLIVVCDKDGYQQTSSINESEVSSKAVLSSIIGGATGWAIDSATGRSNKYDSSIVVKMIPVSP